MTTTPNGIRTEAAWLPFASCAPTPLHSTPLQIGRVPSIPHLGADPARRSTAAGDVDLPWMADDDWDELDDKGRCCDHPDILDRPESDTWQCLWCGTEGTGYGP